MSDESLRSLKRAVEAGDDPATRVRYARALERAGRRDEALDVLAGTTDRDASVRAALARYPAWGQTDADAGRTRFLDLAPIRHEPRLRWTTPPGTAATGSPRVLASPFGVACEDPDQQTLVLDPETGEVRRRFPLVEPVSLASEFLLAKRNTKLRGYALETGKLLHETTTETLNFDVVLANGVLVTSSPSRVQAFALADAVEEPIFQWMYMARETNRKGRFGPAVVTGSEVLVPQHLDVVVLDIQSGALKRRVPGTLVRADANGLLVSEGHKLVMRGHDSNVLWSREGEGLHPIALAPDVVVAHAPESGALLLERATGRTVSRVAEGCDRGLVIRRVVYVLEWGDEEAPDDRLRAFSVTGEPLWDLRLGRLVGEVTTLVAGARRIFGLTRAGSVFCLGEA